MTASIVAVPHESLTRLLLRFLRFGSLAWGGPVAQIAMIRQELVDEEHWVTSEHFNRALALYQVLPGPEAHELCVYFGMRSLGWRPARPRVHAARFPADVCPVVGIRAVRAARRAPRRVHNGGGPEQRFAR